MNYTVRKLTTHRLEIDGMSFNIGVKPDEYNAELQHIVAEDGCHILGYLAQDEDCPNPLDDGIGKILTRDSLRDVYAALNLNRYGEPDLNTYDSEQLLISELEQRISNKVDRCHCKTRRDEIICRYRRIYRKHTEKLIHQYAMRQWKEDCDHMVVLLDKYEHSDVVWSIHGNGTQCRFDTSRNAGVWVPDPYVRECIKKEALMKQMPESVKLDYVASSWTVTTPDGMTLSGFWKGSQALQFVCRNYNICVDAEKLKADESAAAIADAEAGLKLFNMWGAGECYGVVLLTFDANGEPIDDNSCWGYIGFKDAKAELVTAIKAELARHCPQPQKT